jgi:hypothetical protein
MQVITTLIVTALIFLRYVFFEELKINAIKQYYFYYIVLTLVVTLAEIPLDIFVSNIIECWSGLKLSEKIEEYTKIFQSRKRFWAIDDTQHHLKEETKDLNMIKKLGFSYQYYLILSLICFSVVMGVLGIEMISLYSYNPLTDAFMLISALSCILYFALMKVFVKKLFKWYDSSKEQNDITKDNEYEEMIKIRQRFKSHYKKHSEIQLLENYLKHNEKYREPSELLLDELKNNLLKDFDKYKTVKDPDELASLLLGDYLTNILNKGLEHRKEDIEVAAMEIVLSFIKALEYNKLNQDKLAMQEQEYKFKSSILKSHHDAKPRIMEKFERAKDSYIDGLKLMTFEGGDVNILFLF